MNGREREISTLGDCVLFSSVGLWEGFLGVKITRIPYHLHEWVEKQSDGSRQSLNFHIFIWYTLLVGASSVHGNGAGFALIMSLAGGLMIPSCGFELCGK